MEDKSTIKQFLCNSNLHFHDSNLHLSDSKLIEIFVDYLNTKQNLESFAFKKITQAIAADNNYMIGLKERFNQAIEYLIQQGKINKWHDLSDALALSRYAISNLMKGIEKYSTAIVLTMFWIIYGNIINPDWLYNGEGDMLIHTQ